MDPSQPYPSSAALPPGLRLCQKCKAQMPQTQLKCSDCQFVDLDLVPDADSEEEEAKPATWPCACGYGDNKISETTCQRCGQSAFGEPESGIVSRISGFFTRAPELWTCEWCRYEHNIANTCERCSKQQGSAPNESVWSCLNCNTRNSNTTRSCQSCSCGPDWADFLELHQIRLNSARLQWYCNSCTWGTDISSYECSNCKAVPEAVRAFLSKVGEHKWSKWPKLSWLGLS